MRRSLLAALTLVLIASAPAAAATVSFSQSLLIDHQPPYSTSVPAVERQYLNGISCPTPSLCVGVDRSGDVLTSTAPLAGSAAWRIAAVDRRATGNPFAPAGLAAISCPSAHLCVAVDSSGNVVVSKDPATIAPTWTLTHIDTLRRTPLSFGGGFSGVSCPTASLCTAVDIDGNVLISHHPARGRWTKWGVDTNKPAGLGGFTGVSCPSRSLCLAVDGTGTIYTTSNPAGRRPAWARAVLPGTTTMPGARLLDVSCASPSLCALITSSQVYVSTNPTAGSTSWSAVTSVPQPKRLAAVMCRQGPLCVAIGDSGDLLASDNPTAGPAAWTDSQVDPQPSTFVPQPVTLGGVACPTISLCVGVDDAGDELASTDPTGGAAAWQVSYIDGYNEFTGSSCIAGLCAVVDEAGDVLTSTNPTAATSSWNFAHVDSHGLTGISCLSAHMCVAVDGSGNVVTSNDPTGAASGWVVSDVDGANALTAVSCPSATLCVAIDQAGRALSSTEPAGGPSAWRTTQADGDVTSNGALAEPVDLTCPTASLCVAVDNAGNVLTSTDPAAGTWTLADIDGTTGLTGVTCATVRSCIAVDGSKSALASSNPAGGVSAWHHRTLNVALTRRFVWARPVHRDHTLQRPDGN